MLARTGWSIGDPLWSDIRGERLAMPKSERTWEAAKAEIKVPEPGEHWYALHCAGAPDGRVVEVLRRINYDVYVPKCLELRVVPKRQLPPKQRNNPFPIKKPFPVPLFPRYPFARFDLRDDRRHEVFKLMGVQGMLCNSDEASAEPAYIDDRVIDALRAREHGGALPRGTTVKNLAYAIGERVRISFGPFAGQNATVDGIPDIPIEQLDETARLRLLVSLFGRSTIVELSISDLEKL